MTLTRPWQSVGGRELAQMQAECPISWRTMGWRAKNFNEALSPMLILNWITGYTFMEYPLGRKHRGLTFLLQGMTLLFYVTSLYQITPFLQRWHEFFEPELFCISVGIYFFNLIVAIVSLVASWYQIQNLRDLLRRQDAVETTLCRLGSVQTHHQTFLETLRSVLVLMLLGLILSILDITWFYRKVHSFGTSLLIAHVFHYPVLVNSVTDMNVMVAARFLKTRFERLNQAIGCLSDGKERNECARIHADRTKILHKTLLVLSKNDELGMQQSRLLHSMQVIRQLHLKLCGITRDMNHVFGFRTLLMMGLQFCMILATIYSSYINFHRSSTTVLDIVVLSTWPLILAFGVVMVNHFYAVLVSEARKSGYLILEFETDHEPALEQELQQFSLQIMQNPLSCNVYGFFDLGYGFVGGFAGSVCTYLVILMQMET